MRTEVKTASKPSLPNAFIGGPVRIPPGFPLKTCGNDELASELPTCSFILVCERMLINSFVVNLLSCASSQLLRVLQKLFDFQQESSAAMTIADAVVRRQRSFNDWTHADHPIHSRHRAARQSYRSPPRPLAVDRSRQKPIRLPALPGW